MTITDAKHLIANPDLLQAFVDGELEEQYKEPYKFNQKGWFAFTSDWDFDTMNYRRKPKPRNIIVALKSGQSWAIDVDSIQKFKDMGWVIYDAVERL